MNEDFVSFDLAKKLKEKGFNKPFYFYYRTDDECIHHVNTCAPLVYSDKIDDEVVIAPTISQVLKWLREEKKIYLELIIVGAEYMCNIYKIEPRPVEWVGSTEFFSETYESAALAGIKYVIDNLI